MVSFISVASLFLIISLQQFTVNSISSDLNRRVCSKAVGILMDLECDEYSVTELRNELNSAYRKPHLCDVAHVIALNDTCNTIAELYNITVDSLKSSQIDCESLKVGQAICLFTSNSTVDEEIEETDETDEVTDEDDKETTENVNEEDDEDEEDEEDEEDDEDDEDDVTSPEMNSVNKQGLEAHNILRRMHGVSSLTYNASLAEYAQKWAEFLAYEIGAMKYRNKKTYGENIAMAWGKDITGDEASTMWYNEIKDYNFNTGKRRWFGGEIGHFTQLVWAGSKSVGFGKASKNGKVFVVANYSPPGNVQGNYASNVFAKRG